MAERRGRGNGRLKRSGAPRRAAAAKAVAAAGPAARRATDARGAGTGSKAAGSPQGRLDLRLFEHDAAVKARIAALADDRFVERLFARDPLLWSDDPEAGRVIRNRLGWLAAPRAMLSELAALREFADGVRRDRIERTILLGMGGSSLGPEVLRRVFGPARGFPDLVVLDTTVPSAVARVGAGLDPRRTLFIVSSKSGTTIETSALEAHFWGKMQRARGAEAGRHFAAITDPGTPLAGRATTRQYRALWLNPADVGGRYSALTYFGLVPAALLGLDLEALVGRGAAMIARCGPGVPAGENPGLVLGAALAELARRGRDKVHLLPGPALASYGLWIEQLLAESTGKDLRGLVPVAADGLAAAAPSAEAARGNDAVAVAIVGEGESAADVDGEAVPSLTLTLPDRLDLGASMVQWEIATAVAGAILGVNPFDEPNVGESKSNSEAALKEFRDAGRFDEPRPDVRDGRAEARLSLRPGGTAATTGRVRTLPEGLAALLERPGPGDYIAILAYVDPFDARLAAALASLRDTLAARTGLATTVGYGPRYLHSTGQLHKGGPNTGIFIEIVPDDTTPVEIPGAAYDFATLAQAQALGDYRALERRGRRALRLRYDGPARDAVAALQQAARALPAAARAARRSAGAAAPAAGASRKPAAAGAGRGATRSARPRARG